MVLEFDTAGVGSRALALALDLLVQLTALVALLVALGLFLSAVEAAAWLGVSVVTVLVFGALFGYPVAMETLWGGRTLGKAAVGLRVVTVEGTPIRFRHAAARGALLLIDLWVALGMVGAVAILATRRDQRLGDLTAGTLVLRARRAEPEARAVWFTVPPGLEAYAATLDVTGLAPADVRVVRSFLLRAGEFAREVRPGLAAQLARRVASRGGVAVPAHLHPETFLVCVAAAVQARSGFSPPAPASWVPATGSVPAAPADDAVRRPSSGGPHTVPPPPPGPPAPPPGPFAPPG